MKSFQLIVIILFIVFAIGGVILFAVFRDNNNVSDTQIVIWGEEKSAIFNKFLQEFREETDRKFNVEYKEIKGGDFANNVIEAIASGEEPDIIILSSKNLLRFEDKLFLIPFEIVSERNLKDTFIEGGEIFMNNEGTFALPMSVDPLVMYWNRDILQSKGLAAPPRFWSEFFTFAERVTEKDEALNIIKSATALGEYQNIQNAKEIILSLLLQSGISVIERNANNIPQVVLNNSTKGISPSESAVRFYTEFSNPTKTSYSWNRALPNSFDEFISGDLALYFGLASELTKIRERSPNLNFDVALLPQVSGSDTKRVSGEMRGLAILKRSKNIEVALSVASNLVSNKSLLTFSRLSGLPPVRRDLLSESPSFAFENLFYQSALISKSFLDPDAIETDSIFKNLIERIVSGRDQISTALGRSGVELNSLLVKLR